MSGTDLALWIFFLNSNLAVHASSSVASCWLLYCWNLVISCIDVLVRFYMRICFCDICNWCCCSVVDEPCYPYTAGFGFLERCRLTKRSTLLTARCKPPSHPQTVLRTDLYRVGPSYRLGSEEDIMYEIMESGPVQGTAQHLEIYITEITNVLAYGFFF